MEVYGTTNCHLNNSYLPSCSDVAGSCIPPQYLKRGLVCSRYPLGVRWAFAQNVVPELIQLFGSVHPYFVGICDQHCFLSSRSARLQLFFPIVFRIVFRIVSAVLILFFPIWVNQAIMRPGAGLARHSFKGNTIFTPTTTIWHFLRLRHKDRGPQHVPSDNCLE
jgi:hypothetical protein